MSSQEQVQHGGGSFTSGLIGVRTADVESRVPTRVDDVFREADEVTEKVRVVNGANDECLPITGRTVTWARENLQYSFNIAPEATALIDGVKVENEGTTILQASQTLEFLRESGRKGVR